ncbi:M23 family metallopeptidase [Marisediminicola senii]|uniref:M23 family metallopeptidase n=1 Tax=Marisediminicola senii TaxID=2711233 RepID=UPI0013ECD913|nr:M23 family metallopeptidase [Marisediminicola senii]
MTRRELREQEAKAAASAARRPLFSVPTRTAAPRVRRTASGLPGSAAAQAKPVRSDKPTHASRPTATARSAQRGILSNLATVGAMAGVGLILISTTVPANAFVRPVDQVTMSSTEAPAATSYAAGQTQSMTVAAAEANTIDRDSYTVQAKPVEVQVASGSEAYSISGNPSAAVQWPFPGGAPIASGFGPRQVPGCGFCSTYHKGLDFTPGSGVPIHSLADGVVSSVSTASGGFGVHVIVDHVINGQRVQTLYAHMQSGSVQVSVGQSITVGQQIGAVGSTGASTGAHLHLEVHLDGTPVDPFAWLQANAS